MDNTLVKVHQGHLRGVSERNINGTGFIAFRGVPYAKPPIGKLRFRDCEPMPSWSGVKNATTFGNPCAQRDWVTLEIVGSDDCLYLNIYTRMLHPITPKAVMIWIHGGSFICGSGDDFFFGPDYLIEKDIVLVTINYRVGIFGFLNIEDEEAPGNQGLKDQVQALKWIQQNIAHFGGDPNNVTIFGQSAGAASVHYLTVSPLAQGLFHKAILQSGVASHPWASMTKPYIDTVEMLGSILDEDISDMIEFVDYLRTLDAHTLVRAEMKILTRLDHIMKTYPFIPSIDSKAKNQFLTIPIEEAAKAGIKVPCIFGYLPHEGLAYVGAMKNKLCDLSDPNTLIMHPSLSRILEQYNVTAADAKQFFFGEEQISSYNHEQIRDVLSALFFHTSFDNLIEIQSKYMDYPLYVYRFDYELEESMMKNFLGINIKGTCHGDEICLLFYSKLGRANNKSPPKPNATEHKLTQRLTEMWTQFAKTGNPTPQISDLIPVIWEPINSPDEYKCLTIDDELTMIMKKNIIQQLVESKTRVEN